MGQNFRIHIRTNIRIRNTAVHCVQCTVSLHMNAINQCCGSVRFLTRSGHDFRKSPDPDSDLNKFSAKFLLEICLAEICPKKYSHDQNIEETYSQTIFSFYTHQNRGNKVKVKVKYIYFGCLFIYQQ
jgi:hypothetical protein